MREGEPSRLPALSRLISFQSTPMREGEPFWGYATLTSGLFQSTPMREGEPVLVPIPSLVVAVSIHAHA